MRLTLRAFFLVVIVTGIVVCVLWDSLQVEHVKIHQNFIGPLTSGDDSSIPPFSNDSLYWAVTNRLEEQGDPDGLKLDFQNAIIEAYQTTVAEPREVPIIGFAELHRTFYRCYVKGENAKGLPVRKVYYIEKNHFHLLEE